MSWRQDLSDITRDHSTGRLNPQKCGQLIAGSLWSFYMAIRLPDDVAMWVAYTGVVFSWSVTHYGIKVTRGDYSVPGGRPRMHKASLAPDPAAEEEPPKGPLPGQ